MWRWRINDNPILRTAIITGGLWLVVIAWLYQTGFTTDMATTVTLLIAVIGFELHQYDRIAKLEGKFNVIYDFVKKKIGLEE
jgi:hypothetical protein